RILENAQESQDVFHMGSFEKLEAAPLLEGNLAIGELDLEIGRHVAGAKENGDLAQPRSFLVKLQNAIDDELGLLLLIARGDEPRRLSTTSLRPQVLSESLGGARDQRIGDAQDRLRRAVVLLERNHRRARKLPGEVENVPKVRAAKGVDTLRVVADDGNVPVRAAHAAEDACLEHVRILILVDEYVVVEPGNLLPQLGGRLEQQRPEKQQVIVIDEISFLLSPRVVGVDFGEILEVIDELRVRVSNDVLDRDLGVDVPGIDVLQRLLLRETLRLGGIAELGT